MTTKPSNSRRYAAAVTPYLESLIADEPAIARQFVPSDAEEIPAWGESDDPIGDSAHSPVKGIVHRYPDRVLLIPHHACAAYCRFCFRRARVGRPDGALSPPELAAALAYVRAAPAVREVILSGGDPLMLSARRLASLIAALDAIPHVEVIRLHTRIPVVDPDRMTRSLIAALRTSESAVYLVLHCNHPAELTDRTRAACRAVVLAGIPMLAQTVLLKGVNDDPSVLAALMRALVRNRIKPYYLHHCDMAPGTGHFRTTLAEGRALVRALRGEVSGLCQPTYVLDIPGGHGKVPVGPDHLLDGGATVEDPRGNRHAYPPCIRLLRSNSSI
ncbi:MAG: lysine-2,3-aminomutase-like protein [Alphaproteobacteria bacterium]|nr:lysine-2,3-aminomutase-like protein [Alphaproteobacteria bacterium]